MIKNLLAVLAVVTFVTPAFADKTIKKGNPNTCVQYENCIDMYLKYSLAGRAGTKDTADSTAMGLTVGLDLNDWVSTELYTRQAWNTSGAESNDSKVEGAFVFSQPLIWQGVKAQNRVGLGEKFTGTDKFVYWTLEPGLKFQLTDEFNLKTSIRFRDAFDSSHNAQDTTYKVGFGYKFMPSFELGMGVDIKRGDSDYNSLGISIKYDI